MKTLRLALVLSASLLVGAAARAETLTWLGTAGGDWNTASNWDRGRVPAFGDSVTIALAAGTEVVLAGADANITALTMSGALRIEAAQLSVVAPSTVTGTLVLGPGGGILANGEQAVLTVTGTTRIGGGTVLALAGGRVSLPGVSSLVGGGTIRAEGLGSVIEMPNLGTAGLPPATTPVLFEVASRSVSVFNQAAPSSDPLALLRDAVSRPVSVFNRGDAFGDSPPIPRDAVSRSVSLFNRVGALSDTSPLPGDAVSRSVSIANLPLLQLEDLVESAISREVSVDNEPTE